MRAKQFSQLDMVRLVSDLTPYPAVLWPLAQGGYDVIFTNFKDLRAYGPSKAMACSEARVMLTAELSRLINDGQAPPLASNPANLHPDEDEPQGTELVMIEADEGLLKKRLGISQAKRESVLSAISQGWGSKK